MSEKDYKINPQFGMKIPLNPPEIDLNLNQITEKIMVESVKNIDALITGEIVRIARAQGATTLVLLDEDQIMKALERHVDKKVISSGILKYCPTCTDELTFTTYYCPRCGQKLNWEDCYK